MHAALFQRIDQRIDKARVTADPVRTVENDADVRLLRSMH